ncbi:hypothetical protein OHT52_03045 [Streptomyces sp. NBC_00247]|uniref:hypothetical protein n=1 Tax=Streptomyces sp. NBC_00247 TaxID=2975689 RepID=UPI002E2DE545|nr:hypothetical protein [Streptomyces sp. NBC_00247]
MRSYSRTVVSYDNLYRATRSQISLAASDPLVTSKSAAATYTSDTAYNPDGTVASTTEPAAGGLPAETIQTKYTATGQPTSVYSGTSGYLQSASYSAQGQPQLLSLAVSSATGSKKTDLNFDYEPGTDRLLRSYVTTPQTAPCKPQGLTYTYDDAGNVLKITDEPNRASGPVSSTRPQGASSARTRCWRRANPHRSTGTRTPRTTP